MNTREISEAAAFFQGVTALCSREQKEAAIAAIKEWKGMKARRSAGCSRPFLDLHYAGRGYVHAFVAHAPDAPEGAIDLSPAERWVDEMVAQ